MQEIRNLETYLASAWLANRQTANPTVLPDPKATQGTKDSMPV